MDEAWRCGQEQNRLCSSSHPGHADNHRHRRRPDAKGIAPQRSYLKESSRRSRPTLAHPNVFSAITVGCQGCQARSAHSGSSRNRAQGTQARINNPDVQAMASLPARVILSEAAVLRSAASLNRRTAAFFSPFDGAAGCNGRAEVQSEWTARMRERATEDYKRQMR